MNKKTYKTLNLVQNDQVLTVVLNRPDKKNAMSFLMMQELIEVAHHLKKNKDIRAVVLTGANNEFCSGVDLSDLMAKKNQAFALWEFIKPTQSLFQKVCLVWQSVPVPVIAVIEGYCFGAGLQLAMAADIRIATPDSQIAILEAKWGLVADMGITQTTLGILNADVLKELAMTAKIIDGNTAKALGVVTHVRDEPMVKVTELTQQIIDRSPDAVLASKRLVNIMYRQSCSTLYQEKLWQTKLMLGNNRKRAMKKAKDSGVTFLKRQFK